MSFGSMFRWPGWISHHRPLYDGCDLSQEDSMASGASLQDRSQDGTASSHQDVIPKFIDLHPFTT